jgi:hypothetical protein
MPSRPIRNSVTKKSGRGFRTASAKGSNIQDIATAVAVAVAAALNK